MEMVSITVDENGEGQRIDKWLATVESFSRAQIQLWIKEGFVQVGSRKVKPNYKLVNGDAVHIEIPDPEPLEVIPEDIEIDIIYEDEDVIVVNKPQGMVVHPAPGHATGTLVNALMYQCQDLSGINGVLRPGIVHRIDKDTSGLLVVAKNDRSHESLVNQMKDKTVERQYKAIVHGVLPHDKGTIDAPIGRDEKNRKKMAVTAHNGKNAITHFSVIKRFNSFTLVECRLETGRTHQIRVHMKYIGYPIAGDPKYGPKKTLPLEGQALHAGLLGFTHPRTGEFLRFEAQLPDWFTHALEELTVSVK